MASSYQERWREYRRRHSPADLLEAPNRVLDGARFTVAAWQSFFDAVEGWCEEVAADGYAPSRVIPDIRAFREAYCAQAKGLCHTLCVKPLVELGTNEESEMAGPVTLGKYAGPAADLVATNLVNQSDPTAIIPSKHVMLRVVAGEVVVTLVGLRQLAAMLPDGNYLGSVRPLGGAKIADIVNIHRRMGTAQFIKFSAPGLGVLPPVP